MNILVISYSTIVIELLKLVFKDGNIKSEDAKSTDSAQNDSYDIIFVDDSTANFKEEIEYIENNFNYEKLILIGRIDNEKLVDIVVKKPFLPKEIKDILSKIESSLKKPKKSAKTKVLNIKEIAKIKELMALSDVEEGYSKQSILEKLKSKKDLKLKGKDAKEFLYGCRDLTKKELRKLLKGAKVSIKISYKRDGNEQ